MDPMCFLAETHRCECSDVRGSIQGRPTPGANTSIQPLCAMDSKEEKPLGPQSWEDFRKRMVTDLGWDQGMCNIEGRQSLGNFTTKV